MERTHNNKLNNIRAQQSIRNPAHDYRLFDNSLKIVKSQIVIDLIFWLNDYLSFYL